MKTKHYFLLSTILLTSIFTHAQWSTDPASPGIVCDFSGIQSEPQAFADGDGGIYVFWLDHRNGTSQIARDVYGQHFDADGYALWEEDGRMILNHSNQIKWFRASRIFNDEIIIGWITSTTSEPDSLYVQRLDEDGMKVWTNDLAVANTLANPIYILGLYGFHIIHDNSGYCISIGTVYYGGSSGNRITRFSSDGVLTGPYYGEPEGTQYNFGSSGLESCFDANDNVYLYYSSGNGSGANLLCLKVDIAGDTVWGPLNVLTGTNGLSYQFKGISDENGITFVWQGTGDGGSNTNIYARRLNTDGSFAWSGSTTTICAADGEQGIFDCKKSGENYYITWSDGRPGTEPGNYDIYAQKFDINGNVAWAENGILAISLNTYIPYPEFNFSDNNSMIICHQANANGFVAQKVLDDGTVAWDADGNQICTQTYSPFYAEHVEVQTGDKTIAVWAKTQAGGGSNDIYITRVDDNEVSSEKELVTKNFQVYPNPASDEFTVVLPENMNDADISLFDSFGKEVYRTSQVSVSTNQRVKISTAELPAGIYFIKIQSGDLVYSEKVVVR